jgi:hypothetical protein
MILTSTEEILEYQGTLQLEDRGKGVAMPNKVLIDTSVWADSSKKRIPLFPQGFRNT